MSPINEQALQMAYDAECVNPYERIERQIEKLSNRIDRLADRVNAMKETVAHHEALHDELVQPTRDLIAGWAMAGRTAKTVVSIATLLAGAIGTIVGWFIGGGGK